jgi:hypothetical protein
MAGHENCELVASVAPAFSKSIADLKTAVRMAAEPVAFTIPVAFSIQGWMRRPLRRVSRL